ncbi:MAG: acetate--CoA ligase family protein, partial [Desulfuromonadales bacterium]|nr:acetate--CoA ligase family protein [Desulfuromonadales bacterium]
MPLTSASNQPAASNPQPIQATRHFTLTLSQPDELDLALTDRWLNQVLQLEPEAYAGPNIAADDKDRALMAGFVWRGLRLCRTLLQTLSIPTYYPGKILSLSPLEQASGQWRVTVALSHVEHVPQESYPATLNAAFNIIRSILNQAISPITVNALFHYIESNIIDSSYNSMLSGKSTLPILHSAWQMDIPFLHLGAGVYQLGWGAKGRKMDRSLCEGDSAIGAKLAQNKVWTANLLRMAGLPAPDHAVVNTVENAVKAAQQLGWPLVIKPADGDRGEGVSIDLNDEESIKTAIDKALAASKMKQALVEKQVAGVCHRIFVSHGQLLYATKRNPKSVQADGKSTVAELIAAAEAESRSKPPWLRDEPFPSDALAIE